MVAWLGTRCVLPTSAMPEPGWPTSRGRLDYSGIAGSSGPSSRTFCRLSMWSIAVRGRRYTRSLAGRMPGWPVSCTTGHSISIGRPC